MDPCHSARCGARSRFIVTPYRPANDGIMRPDVPHGCYHAQPAGSSCELRVQHWRHRKTGPEFPLLVMQCLTHGIAFTLYPPGHVPYGRRAIAPVDLQGQPLRGITEQRSEATLAWEQTLFGAAQDATRQQAWPRCGGDGLTHGCWRTQGRRIGQLAQILGLVGNENSPIVGPLGVSTLGHREATAAYGQARGYQARGAAVWQVAMELQCASWDLLDLLLQAGLVAGTWGQAYRWDARTEQLRAIVPRARSP